MGSSGADGWFIGRDLQGEAAGALRVPFHWEGGSLSLLTSTLTVELHQPESQQEVERMLGILQTLLQPEPRFTTSAAEQTLLSVKFLKKPREELAAKV